jgi:hypothetical protein
MRTKEIDMTRVLKPSLLLAGVFLMLTTGAANASEVMTVNVPFPFVVRHETFPAGKYLLERDDMSPSVMLIEGVKGNKAATFVATNAAAGHDPAGQKPCLTFARTEKNQYRLSNIWESGEEGRTVTAKE